MKRISRLLLTVLMITLTLFTLTLAAGAKEDKLALKNPKMVSIDRTQQGLKVSWKKAKNAKKYIVYRRLYKNKKWVRIATVSSKKLSYVDKNVKTSTKYSYYVKAQNGKTKSVYDGKFLSRAYVKTPEKLTLTQKGKTVTLKWEKVKGAKNYQIYRKLLNSSWKKLATVKGNKTSYKSKLSSPFTCAEYKIRVYAKYGKSEFTDVVLNYSFDPEKPLVALTYDDGPHSVYTNTILDALEENDARATFFVVGNRIEYFSDCLERQGELGCEVGSHTYSHAYLSSITDKQIATELSSTAKLIKKYAGNSPELLRAPGGSIGAAADKVGYPLIQWSVDTRDWESRNKKKITAHIKEYVRDGSIILMHDIYEATASASEDIIPWLVEEGYELVTVSQLMQARGVKLKDGNVYYNAYP